jgi:hypothetical protein
MEIIIFIAVVVVAALLWSGYVKTKKTESDQTLDNWQPPKASPEKEWPFSEKLSEGKIHVKVADVATVTQLKTAWIEATAPVAADSQDRVETPTPTVADATADNKAKAVTKAKKAPAKKPAAAKKAPAKKKST